MATIGGCEAESEGLLARDTWLCVAVFEFVSAGLCVPGFVFVWESEAVGETVGAIVPEPVSVGDTAGDTVGDTVGGTVGDAVGDTVGVTLPVSIVGETVGLAVGDPVGDSEGVVMMVCVSVVTLPGSDEAPVVTEVSTELAELTPDAIDDATD